MPYCSSDSKLAGYDDMEAEITDESLDGTTLSFTIHLNRPCASCSTEAATANLELSFEIEHECEQPDADDEDNWNRRDVVWRVKNLDGTYPSRAEAIADTGANPEDLIADWDDSSEPEYELQSSDVETTDDMQTRDRFGNPIKSSRYMKRLLGASVTAHVHCERCEEDFDVDGNDNMPASSFEVMSH